MDGNGRIVAGGGEVTIEAMDQYDRLEIGRKPYEFACRVFQDPELRKQFEAKKMELLAAGYFT